MLVTLSEILKIAVDEKKAVGAFNTSSLAALISVIDAAEELSQPVIIMHAQVHEELMPLNRVGYMMVEAAKRAKVPVCVHLDHGTDLEYLKRALEIGFTSIMYDGSHHEYEINRDNTILAVKMAKKFNASVEAEIGVLGSGETGGNSEHSKEDIYTDPLLAKKFVNETGIDALACSFGTAHGLYRDEPKLDFDLIKDIRCKISVPIVMHGGSGVSADDYEKAIESGVKKINYYTYMAKAGADKVIDEIERNEDRAIYYHDIVTWGIDGMKSDVKKAIKIFANL